MNERIRKVVDEGTVVTMEFTLYVEGELVEDTSESEPIQFLQGAGQVLPSLEKQLFGLKVGDQKKISLRPSEAYGEVDDESYSDIPRVEFPKEIPLKQGVELEIKDQDGENHYARIEAVDHHNVRLNFNHILAGKTLDFQVHITALRDPTPEEREQGYVI